MLQEIEVKARDREVDVRQKYVEAREKEVEPRQREISFVHFSLLYSNLRQDLTDEKEEGDAEEVQWLKDEMNRVKNQRLNRSMYINLS